MSKYPKQTNYFISCLLAITSYGAFGQTTVTEVDVNANTNINHSEYVCEEINLGTHGYIFKTASPLIAGKNRYSKSQVVSVYYYGANLELKWKKELESSFYPMFPLNQFDRIISSGDGSVVYDLQIKKKTNIVNRITESGEVKTTDLSKYEMTENLQSVFCDTDNLYYLVSADGNEKGSNNKKVKEKLILHSVSNNDFTHKVLTLQLPEIENSDNSAFWSYIGQNNDLKLIGSKNVNLKTGKNFLMLVAFDATGTIKRNLKIEFSYPEYELNDSRVIHKGQYIFNLVDLDHFESMSTQNPRTISNNSAFYTTYLDPYHNALYLLGVIESKKKQSVFIQKYSLTGELLWKEIYPVDKVSEFAFNILSDESLNFSYFSKAGLVIHEVSNGGQQVSKQTLNYNMNGFLGYDNTIAEGKYITGVSSGKTNKSFEKIKTMAPKEKEIDLFSNYVSASGKILLISNRKGKIKIIQFK